jgi:hypothetical protein
MKRTPFLCSAFQLLRKSAPDLVKGIGGGENPLNHREFITLLPRSRYFTLLLISLLVASLTACDSAESKPGKEIAPGVRLLARMSDKRIVESSGVAASQRYPGVLWTHNDGGGKRQALYAIDRNGSTRASIPVPGLKFRDWEDIAIDDAGHLYLGDIGNNDGKRDTLYVYSIDEPNPNTDTEPIEVKREWQLKFPGAPFNCETLFIWKGYGYVVSKVFDDARAQVFRFPLKGSQQPVTLQLVTTLTIQSPVTGGAISADGKLLGLVAKNGAYVYRIDGDVARVGKILPAYTRCKDMHIESCCFVSDGLLATSENREIFLFTAAAFRGQ